MARSLRTKRSAVLGALIPDIANPFFASILRGMEDAAAERDYSIILANTDDLPAREAHGLAMLRDRQVDGLLLATARRNDPAIEQLAAERIPFVLVNRHTNPITPNAVVPDDYAGAARRSSIYWASVTAASRISQAPTMSPLATCDARDILIRCGSHESACRCRATGFW